MALAHRAGLGDLVADTLTLKAEGGANAHLKVPALVAGMVVGCDSIDDMDVLRARTDQDAEPSERAWYLDSVTSWPAGGRADDRRGATRR
jgi:hypothetical protein